jgi:hypothetical protein
MRPIPSLMLLLLAGCASAPNPAQLYMPPPPTQNAAPVPAVTRPQVPIPPPAITTDVAAKKHLEIATDAYIVCSIIATESLALQPENPAHIAITATTLCGQQGRELRIAAATIVGPDRAFGFASAAEATVREHLVALVVTIRAKARQPQQEQPSQAKPPAKKGQEI